MSKTKEINATISPGVVHGDRVHLSGEDNAGIHGGTDGNFYKVQKDPRFRRGITKIYTDVSVGYLDTPFLVLLWRFLSWTEMC